MIEHKFPYESFIGGWYIKPNICDDLTKLFNDNEQSINPGLQLLDGNLSTIKDHKDSMDFTIDPNYMGDCVGDYRKALQEVLEKYILKYPDAGTNNYFNITEDYNIQYYKPGGGFYKWHCERANLKTSHRLLVFMTYLNDVDDGGTYFKNQNLLVPAKKGLTLIWPTDWTHIHKGQISNTKEKYITTGWFSFYE